MDTTFTQIPLQMDPSSKTISCSSMPNDTTLATALSNLNSLHRTILSLPNATPPPPVPVNPKRSAQIQKMREQANATMKKAASIPSQAQEAVKLYTFALQIALTRPPVESAGLLREEASLLYANRAQAYMAASQWPEGATDAACSVELKRQGNGKAWFRRARCLVEMSKWDEARKVMEEGKKEVEENEEGYREMVDLGKEIGRHLEERMDG